MYAIGLRTLPDRRHHTIVGVPADVFFRVAAPIATGLLSVVGLIYAVRGKSNVATAFMLTGLVLTSIVSAGQAVVSEEERGRL